MKLKNRGGQNYPIKCTYVRWISSKDTITLLNAKTQKYYLLNEVASLIWQFSDGAHSVFKIIKVIESRFTGQPNSITSHVYSFLDFLKKRGLINF